MPISEKLIPAYKFVEKGKYKEAQNFIINVEKRGGLTQDEKIECKVLKGLVNNVLGNFKEALKVTEQAYHESLQKGNKLLALDALNYRMFSYWQLRDLGKFEEVIIKYEKLLNALRRVSSRELVERKIALMAAKGGLHSGRAEWDLALKYQEKALRLSEEIDDKGRIAFNLSRVAKEYYYLGEINQALNCAKHLIGMREIRNYDTISALHLIGEIHRIKGELNLTLEYYEKAFYLAEELDDKPSIIESLYRLGLIHYEQNELDKASEFLKRSVKLSEKQEIPTTLINVLNLLVCISVDSNSLEKARYYLQNMRKLSDQNKLIRKLYQVYRIANAYMLKSSTQVNDLSEAEHLYRQVIEEDVVFHGITEIALVNLCGILFDRLSETNNPKILNEIRSIINRLLKISEDLHSYMWLANTYFLQAKLALIEKDIKGARTLFSQAQQMADWHGFKKLAQFISIEHDKFLEDIEKWKEIHESNASISERLDLTSMKGTLDIILEKRGLKPPELVVEIPVLLLIITEENKIFLSNPFTGDFILNNDLIIDLLSSFKAFSNQIFSEKLDRVKFGHYTILITAIEPFSICYMFQGQTYSARQKLIHFTENLQKNSMILNLLNDAANSGRILDVNEYPSIEELIIKSFMSDPQLFRVPFKAYEGEDPFVFASYAHRDKLEVYPIIDYLNKTGINIWYDEGIPFSENWKKSIANNIEQCQEFLVFITPNILDSEYVRKEISFALGKKKGFNVVYLKETKLPSELEFEIQDIQALHKYLMPELEFSHKLRDVLYAKLDK